MGSYGSGKNFTSTSPEIECIMHGVTCDSDLLLMIAQCQYAGMTVERVVC